MECPNCNQEIDDNSVFCEYCGTKIIPCHGSGSRPSSRMPTGGSMSKAKNIVLILTVAFAAIIAILMGEEGLLIGLSFLLSGGLFYWLYASKISDALKITLTVVFALTGIVRAVTINGSPAAFAIILIIEVVIMAIAYYNSTK